MPPKIDQKLTIKFNPVNEKANWTIKPLIAKLPPKLPLILSSILFGSVMLLASR